jgi:FkbM family methyltransferase
MNSNLEYFLKSPSAWRAFISWPKFSATSFRIVSSLARQGIVPKTVIDVGANAGQFTVACANVFSGVTVHSFEPIPDCIAKLTRNVSKLGSVRVYPVALGEQIGEIAFHINSLSQSSSILTLGDRHRRAFPRAREINTIKVRLSTLDVEMGSVLLQAPVLLKVDVQGYELQVLHGATKTLERVDFILLEASFSQLYEGEKLFMEIVHAMDERGFEFLRPIAWLDDPRSGEVLQVDALFARRGNRK